MSDGKILKVHDGGGEQKSPEIDGTSCPFKSNTIPIGADSLGRVMVAGANAKCRTDCMLYVQKDNGDHACAIALLLVR